MSAEYNKPALKKLGSFRDLTQSGAGPLLDGCTATGCYDPNTGSGFPTCGVGGRS